ncbi:MAG: hypothetical protein H6Q69_4703 [Firmicutes bacterium]|nr:hypothetical protein [Bacillota bacterium]
MDRLLAKKQVQEAVQTASIFLEFMNHKGTMPLGDTIFASVSEYETEPKEKRKPEAHQKYIDIQYVVSGEEMIGCSPLSPEYEVLQDELTLRDLIFYQGVQQEVELLLKPGIYAVLFPNDVHRPNCTLHSTTKVKKVVLKIALSAL